MDEKQIQDIIEVNRALCVRLKRDILQSNDVENLKVAGQLAISLLECTIAYMMGTINQQDMKNMIGKFIKPRHYEPKNNTD